MLLKKRHILVTAAVSILVLAFSGCSKKNEISLMEKIQNSLAEMKSYECTATLKRISNKGENVYETKQYFKTTGEYRLELTSPESVAGNYTVFDGETICQYNPRVGGKVTIPVKEGQTDNQLFLGAFINNYFQSEEVSIEASNMDDGKCTVLEAVIPGGSQYVATEKLWIDNETLEPVQFIIYDKNDGERYIITYRDFKYNTNIDDSVFKTTE